MSAPGHRLSSGDRRHRGGATRGARSSLHAHRPEGAQTREAPMIDFVVHDEQDSVGVVVVEGVKAGQALTGWVMEQDTELDLRAAQDIRSGTSSRSGRFEAAIPSSSTASTSDGWWPTSGRASTPTCTTSRPSAGRRSKAWRWNWQTPSSAASAARTGAWACAITWFSCRWTISRMPPARRSRTTSRG